MPVNGLWHRHSGIRRKLMTDVEKFEALVLGGGQGGQLIAWHFAQVGQADRKEDLNEH
jgi:hypothetical protein